MNEFKSSITPGESQFLGLIRRGLMSDPPVALTDSERDELLSGASAICWDEVMLHAQQQVMLGIIYRAVTTLPADMAPPPGVLCDLSFQAEQIRERNLLMEKRCKQISHYFAEKGFRTMVVKGQGLAQYYPASGIRTSGDIDLWVWREGLSLSQNRREMISYINQLMEEHGLALRKVNYHHIDFPIFKDTEVEVHFTPGLFHNPFKNRYLQRFFLCHRSIAEQQQDCTGESGYCVPTLQMNIPFVISHAFRHLLSEGIGLRQILDCYMVIQAFSNATVQEREAAIADLRHLGVLPFTRELVGALALFIEPGSWMIVNPDYKGGADLLKGMLSAGNLGKGNNVSSMYDNRLAYALKITGMQARFFFRYPSEVFWSPLFRAWHVIWRIVNGYKYK